MKLHRTLLLLLAALGCSGPLAAEVDYPEPLQALVGQGVEVVGYFAAPDGLEGYVGRYQGEAVAMYMVPGGEHVLLGRLLDVFGDDVTADHLQRYLPAAELEDAWQLLEQADWVAEGAEQPERIIYIFTDPQCPYCHTLWENARAYLADSNAQLRHIIVGVMHETSLQQAAWIYAAADPVRALQPGLVNMEPTNAEEVAEKFYQQVERNNALMQQLAVQITPTILYRDSNGRVRMMAGLPDDAALAQEIFQLPRQ